MEYEAYAQHNFLDAIRVYSPSPHDDDCSNLSQSSIMNRHTINYSKEVDYTILLLELREIKIFDRINFATRLLSKNKKIVFINQLQQRIVKFPFLDNLLLFTKFYKEEMSKTLEGSNQFRHTKQEKPREEAKKNRKNSSDTSSKYFTQQQL